MEPELNNIDNEQDNLLSLDSQDLEDTTLNDLGSEPDVEPIEQDEQTSKFNLEEGVGYEDLGKGIKITLQSKTTPINVLLDYLILLIDRTKPQEKGRQYIQ